MNEAGSAGCSPARMAAIAATPGYVALVKDVALTAGLLGDGNALVEVARRFVASAERE
jgi:hypothetical protein